MDDYYSYKPRVRLTRPLILTALPGTELTAIVKMVGSYTGVLPLLVDRELSHILGHQPDKFTAEAKHEDRWRMERGLLTKAFSSATPVVAFSSYSMVHANALPWLRERGDTVFLREDRTPIVRRVGREVAKDATRHWLLVQGAPMDLNHVHHTLDEHVAAVGRCDRVVDVVGHESHAIAYQLLKQLGLED